MAGSRGRAISREPSRPGRVPLRAGLAQDVLRRTLASQQRARQLKEELSNKQMHRTKSVPVTGTTAFAGDLQR